MKLKDVHAETGLVYEIEDTFEEFDKPVRVGIMYSGGEDNEVEFCWAQIESFLNPDLPERLRNKFNKELECGREELYAKLLKEFYANTDIKFITEYEI